MPYDHLPLEALQQLHNEVRDALRTRQGKPNRVTVLEQISPDSNDFMGTGLTLQEFIMSGEIEWLARSYHRQELQEQRRRRDAVIALAIELGEVLKITIQASAHARAAIPAVLDGDWDEVRGCRDVLTFEGDWCGPQETCAPPWKKFVGMLDAVLGGVPEETAPALEIPPGN